MLVSVGSTVSVHLLVAGEPFFLCSFFGSTLIVIMILGLFGVSFKGGLFNGNHLSMQLFHVFIHVLHKNITVLGCETFITEV